MIYIPWPHSQCPTYFDLWLLVLFKHKFKGGWNSAESFCWTHTKVGVLLDVSALVGKERERVRERKRGRCREREFEWGCTMSLAKDSLPGPKCFPFTPDKANTEAGAFVCLFKGTRCWCHITKCDRANRNVTIKNQVCFYTLIEQYDICYMISSRELHPVQKVHNPHSMKKHI